MILLIPSSPELLNEITVKKFNHPLVHAIYLVNLRISRELLEDELKYFRFLCNHNEIDPENFVTSLVENPVIDLLLHQLRIFLVDNIDFQKRMGFLKDNMD